MRKDETRTSRATAPRVSMVLPLVLALGPGMSVGCGPDEELLPRTCTDPDVIEAHADSHPNLPLVRQTEHLDIYADEGFFVCAGMAVELERHVAFVAQQLGVDLREHIPFYYTYDLPDECSATALGCTMDDGAAYGLPTTAYHELTHAVSCQLRIAATPTYTEGLAAMFEQARRGHQSYASTFDGSMADLLVAETTNYSYAGHFVRWLFERESGRAFAEVYATSPGHPPPFDLDRIVSVLEGTYDADLEELVEEYEGGAAYAWVPFRQCADIPHINSEDEEWHIDGAMDCDDESTMGPYERPHEISVAAAAQYMYQSVTFEVVEPGSFSVEISGASHVNFARCAERHASSEEEQLSLFDTAVALSIEGLPTPAVELTPGLWRADILQRHELPGPFSVVIRLDDGA